MRVRIGVAKLRQATPTGGNMSAAVEVAADVLKTIAVENDFKEAHGELADMLPTIAEGLVAKAQQTPTQPLADQIRQTLAMIEKYVPKDMRPESRLKRRTGTETH